jgi:hypothetical protein
MTVRNFTEAKAQAKAPRSALAAQGTVVGHAQALELIARQNGARDWNTLSAQLAKPAPVSVQVPVPAPLPLPMQQRVQGSYLGQAFTGTIKAMSSFEAHYSVTVRRDEPVDTVTFEGFSNMRRMISGVVDMDAIAIPKTSNGMPHLTLRVL